MEINNVQSISHRQGLKGLSLPQCPNNLFFAQNVSPIIFHFDLLSIYLITIY